MSGNLIVRDMYIEGRSEDLFLRFFTNTFLNVPKLTNKHHNFFLNLEVEAIETTKLQWISNIHIRVIQLVP